MRRLLYTLTVLTLVVVGLAAQSGGVFQPAVNYTIPGAWAFTGQATLTSPVLITPAIGAATGASLAATGAITSSGAAAGIGYATGAGCAVTQASTRATGVTCAGLSGAITTDTTSLAAGAEAEFTVTDTSVAVGDVIVVSLRSGASANTSVPVITTVASGSFKIELTNLGAGADTGASIINFVVFKAVAS